MPGSAASIRSRGRFHLPGVAAELLAHANRHGILQMGAADLDDVVEFRRLALESEACELPHRGKQAR